MSSENTVLDCTNVVYDEDAEYFEDSIPIGVLINRVKDDLPSYLHVTSINFQGAILIKTAFRRVVYELLSLLPNVKFLDFFGADIKYDTKHLTLLRYILQNYENIEYIDIVGTTIALRLQITDVDNTFRKKVIFVFRSLCQEKLRGDNLFLETHLKYYDQKE